MSGAGQPPDSRQSTPPPSDEPAWPGISVRDLSIRVGAQDLLRGAEADFPRGGVTLVVGTSGAGKTVLMKVLAGLIQPATAGFTISGSVKVEGSEVLHPTRRPRSAPVGLVFQNFALFDELSSRDNIRFAVDHAPPDQAPRQGLPDELMTQFGIPEETPVARMSGGQKQRLALARTLAFDPPVLIYDEPTSGLDPANAMRVVDRIRETGARHQKTTVVVTHDYKHLTPIADKIYLLDAETKALTEVGVDELEERAAAARVSRDETTPSHASRPSRPSPSTFRRLSHRLKRGATLGFEASGSTVLHVVETLFDLIPRWRSWRWGMRYLWHYLTLIASPGAWFYFASAGVIAGFVSTHFVFKFLPHKKYTEPLVSDELLNGLGFALYRVLVPVLLTILLAARCGAAVASDVGNRTYNHQTDAMSSLAARPRRYLLTNILWAFLLSTPVLVAVGFIAARYTSLVVFAYNYPDLGGNYWDGHFHRDLRVPGEWLYWGSYWLLAKISVAGLGVGAIAYHVGILPKKSGVEVSRGITTTIIAATLYVLLVHFLFAFAEFEAISA